MKFELNEEQLQWLTTIVKYRIEDETNEMKELVLCKMNDSIKRCQSRIDMWQSIFDELTKGGESK